MRRFLIGLGVLVALAAVGAVVVFVSFSGWRETQLARLTNGSKVAKTAKGPLEYALTGSGKRTILFVHGTPGGYDQGARFAEAGQRLGYRVLRVSRPGYLRTPLTTGIQPADQADAYAALLDTLGIDKVSVVGVSGGGPSSAQFAARHPDRCEALMMMFAVSKPRPAGKERRPSLVEAFFRGTDFGAWVVWRGAHRDPATALKRMVRDPALQQRIASKPEQLQAYLALADSALVLPTLRGEGLANDAHWFTEMPEIPLDKIKAPTLAVHGDKDTNVEIDNAQLVVEKVPGAELVRIEGADHFVSLSHPEETFGPVFQLLERIGKANGAAALTAQAAAAPAAAGAVAAPPPPAAAAPAPAAAK